MSDIQGFPHILHKILHHADRATLAVMIRLSAFTRDFTEPFLYPTRLIDPFLLPGMSFNPADPCKPELNLTPERSYRKLDSFLSSPNLTRVNEILITHPEVWAEYVRLAGHMPPPAVRAGGTITTIVLKPVGIGLDEKGRRDKNRQIWKDLVSHKREWSAREDDRVANERAKYAAQHTSTANSPQTIYPHRDWYVYPPPDPLFVPSPGYNARWPEYRNAHQFKHIFDIALLIPSSRLILHLPFAAHIELPAVSNAAIVAFESPRGMTLLTLLVECGNPRPLDASGAVRGTDANTTWTHVEMVLVPNSVGVFTAFDCFGDTPSDHTLALDWQDQNDKLDKIMYTIAGVAHGLSAAATYTIIGLENIDIMDGHQDIFEYLLPERIRCGGSAGAGWVEVEFKALEEWKGGASGKACVQYL